MVYDILIVGSGPAGVTASIYAARASKTVLVIEKEAFGGLITHSPKRTKADPQARFSLSFDEFRLS